MERIATDADGPLDIGTVEAPREARLNNAQGQDGDRLNTESHSVFSVGS